MFLWADRAQEWFAVAAIPLDPEHHLVVMADGRHLIMEMFETHFLVESATGLSWTRVG